MGRRYSGLDTGNAGLMTTTLTLTGGRVYAQPFTVPRTTLFNAIGFNITGGFFIAGSAHHALYRMRPEDLLNADLIASIADVPYAAVPGAYEAAITLQVNQGVYWLMSAFDSTPIVTSMAASVDSKIPFGLPGLGVTPRDQILYTDALVVPPWPAVVALTIPGLENTPRVLLNTSSVLF